MLLTLLSNFALLTVLVFPTESHPHPILAQPHPIPTSHIPTLSQLQPGHTVPSFLKRYRSIYLPTYLYTYLSIDLLICQFSSLSVSPSVGPLIYLSIFRSIYLSIYLPKNHLFIDEIHLSACSVYKYILRVLSPVGPSSACLKPARPFTRCAPAANGRIEDVRVLTLGILPANIETAHDI